MENNNNRRILVAIGIVLFLAIIVIVWYFSYAKPITNPTSNRTNDPLLQRILPPRFSFILWGNDTGTSTTVITDPLKDPLIEVWKLPSTGQTFIERQTLKEITSTTTEGTSTKVIEIKKSVRATSTILIFVDRGTGYIYGYPLQTGKLFQISNTVIPGIYDAYFFNNGRRVIMRYPDREKNTVIGVVANVPDVSDGEEAVPLENVQYLTSEVVSVAVNAKKDEASYIVASGEGSAIYRLNKKDPYLVTSSPFREWSLSYGKDSSLFVTTKPSAYVEGSTFSIPQFQSETGERTGLMSNPSWEGTLLNSMWAKSGLVTFLSHNGSNQVLPFSTLASKCSWGENEFLICAIPTMIPRTTEGLPDDWFQGRIAFKDTLSIIDIKTNTPYPLFSFDEKLGSFDVKGITITKMHDIFSFVRNQNGSLWLLNTNLIRETE